jgi:hypothetical protein
VARRGLGPDELRLASPPFLDAVRWTVFAEKVYAEVDAWQPAAQQSQEGLKGQMLNDVIASRKAARETIAQLRGELLLTDDVPAEAPTDV